MFEFVNYFLMYFSFFIFTLLFLIKFSSMLKEREMSELKDILKNRVLSLMETFAKLETNNVQILSICNFIKTSDSETIYSYLSHFKFPNNVEEALKFSDQLFGSNKVGESFSLEEKSNLFLTIEQFKNLILQIRSRKIISTGIYRYSNKCT